MKLKLLRKRLLIFLIIAAMLCAFSFWQNNAITTTEITYKNDKIPASFNGYKILQISDLHGKEFGQNQKKLLSKIEDIKPDMIVITGDLIDSKKGGIEEAMTLVKGIVSLTDVYYASGNHEAWSNSYDSLKSRLQKEGVTVLDNEKASISIDGDSIDLLGLSDPAFNKSNDYTDDADIKNQLKTLCEDDDKFKILLSHRPELLDIYAENNVDLVFSGHAHGGQVRIPFVGGLVAPDQGLLPKLTEGMHKSNNTSMIISRGLGNSIIPQRIFNRPELIVVTLQND